jgi:predicted TIM-barrel fold metal-dependent hydrolase
MTDSVSVIDVDSHLVEVPDLWTSRMVSQKWGDRIPHVRWDEARKEDTWFVGDTRILPAGVVAHAGWREHFPGYPKRFTEVIPAAWDSRERIKYLDRFGIFAQILYSNVALFNPGTFLNIPDGGPLILECVKVYNDYQTEWCGAAPDRLIPMAQLPFWDRDATVAEIERCAAMGHKGVVFSQEPGVFGLPPLADRHWDRVWAVAQDNELPVNFHIGSAVESMAGMLNPSGDQTLNAAETVVQMSGNIRTIGRLIMGGVCHRFPRLNFVSVESGVGWLPFCLEALDWQWQNYAVWQEHPDYDLLPSEYFRRQIYGCFWFEGAVARLALELLGPDNILYETDFPHPTSMSPGPSSPAVAPLDYIRQNLADLSEETLRKVLHDNAARIYHL